jgi:hypothetical protein
MGEERLGPGDGFFVDHDVPYTYETAPTVSKCSSSARHDLLDIRFKANTKASWDKIIAKMGARQTAPVAAKNARARGWPRRRPRSTAPGQR